MFFETCTGWDQLERLYKQNTINTIVNVYIFLLAVIPNADYKENV